MAEHLWTGVGWGALVALAFLCLVLGCSDSCSSSSTGRHGTPMRQSIGSGICLKRETLLQGSSSAANAQFNPKLEVRGVLVVDPMLKLVPQPILSLGPWGLF